MAKYRDLPHYQRRIDEFFTTSLYMGMPMVHTSDGYLVPWDKSNIKESLLKYELEEETPEEEYPSRWGEEDSLSEELSSFHEEFLPHPDEGMEE